ncbi:MAG: 8-oxo-dGTP diphosphatase [Candidatus Saccharibacteria bacterium]|nr:8-oxo-dGTP diphosphatase [Candidatus Saccharibacteria bacterium]
MRKVIAAKAVIWNGGKVLLVHRVGDNLYSNWEVPGGRIEADELLADGLRREVREEIGPVDFEIGTSVGADEWTPTKDGEKLHIVGVFISCTVSSAEAEKLQLSDEHDDLAWILPEELANYDIAPGMRTMIENSARLRSIHV